MYDENNRLVSIVLAGSINEEGERWGRVGLWDGKLFVCCRECGFWFVCRGKYLVRLVFGECK